MLLVIVVILFLDTPKKFCLKMETEEFQAFYTKYDKKVENHNNKWKIR